MTKALKANKNLILTPELRAEMLQAVKTSSFVQAKVEEAKKVLKTLKKANNE